MSDGWVIFGQPVRARSCGSCKSCCTQVPVRLDDAEKPSNVRCRHLCSKGCSIYLKRPTPCVVWSCRWLFDADTATMRRPDLAGYIIDPMLDVIIADNKPKDVLQVWCDPKRRDAHRDPELRAYLARVAETHGLAAIVRWSSTEALVLVAPCLTGADDWYEIDTGEIKTQQHINDRVRELGSQPPIDRVWVSATTD